MKKFFWFIFGFLCFHIFCQNVVINEVLYDPDGSDGGYEWIELYNNSDEDVDLAGWKIEKAGSSFDEVFTFPSIQINSQSYLLIGEEFVPNTDLTEDLSFQNGGSATDGIRLVSSDTLYTDTVLYDSPNTNNLPDDISNPGIYYAVDVSSGNSLARKQNGVDTNNCEQDFFECENPTPGEENFYPIDLAIYEVEIVLNNGDYWLETEVFNLSTENVDNCEASVEVTINSEFYGSYDLPEIPAESSIPFSCNLEQFSANYNVTSAEVIYQFDNMLDNNFAANSILIGNSDLVLNEFLFCPQSTNQEWLEIFNRGDCGYLVDNWKIIDASGGDIAFSCTLQPNEFLVVCEDANLMSQIYPEIDPNLVIQSDDWTSLNNTEESLTLMDNYSVIFDSMYYDGSGCPADFSIERVNPFDDENIEWLVSLDSLGTPTLQNSVLPIEKDLFLEFRDIKEIDGEIQHMLFVKNCGLENIDSILLSCFKTELEAGVQEEAYSQDFTINDSLEIVFNTDIPSTGYYEYNYEIYSDEDMDENNNFAHSFFNRSSLPFVINEIMYKPMDDLPEWLEIKQNFPIPDLEEFYLAIDEDTLCLPFFDEEFALVTSSYSDADTLQQLYDLSETQIFLGMSSLSNNGEQISLLDECGNLIETFFYFPEWNDDLSGISIERVNSCLPATGNNWGPSVNGCTPATENSIFVQTLPANTKLKPQPNPFSPYRGEHTIFNYKLPEIISRMTLRIFDLKGRLVRKLVNQQLMAAEGGIVWNGKDDNGKNLSIGVYIVLMQATARDSEKVYEKKITVVIGK